MIHKFKNQDRPSKGERLNWVRESELKFSTIKLMSVKGSKVYSSELNGSKTFCETNKVSTLLIP